MPRGVPWEHGRSEGFLVRNPERAQPGRHERRRDRKYPGLFIIARQAGEAGYLDGCDIVPDGIIDENDVLALVSCFGQSATTTGTTLCGQVFDGQGSPLEGVEIQLELPDLSPD